MKKIMTKLAKSLKLPKHLEDNSVRDAFLSFFRDTRKMTSIFFILIIVLIAWAMFAGDSFEDPDIRHPIFATETPRPAYSTQTPLPLDMLTATATSTPQ